MTYRWRLRHRPSPALFPYTTLFRSRRSKDFLISGIANRLRGDVYRPNSKSRREATRAAISGWFTQLAKHQRFIDQDERSEEHTSELQTQVNIVCRLLLAKKNCKQTA